VPVTASYYFFQVHQVTLIPQIHRWIRGFVYYNNHIVTLLDTPKIVALQNHKKIERCVMVKYKHHYYGWIIDSAGEIIEADLKNSKKDIFVNYILQNHKKIEVLEVASVLKKINLDD